MTEQIKKIISTGTKRLKAKMSRAGLWDGIVSMVPKEYQYAGIKDSELVYLGMNPSESPFCKYGNIRYFYSLEKGYGERCSVKSCPCREEWRKSSEWQERSKKAQQRREDTLQAHYGVSNPSCSKEIQEKKIISNQERFGCDWPGESEVIKDKIKNTTRERYGVDSVMQLPEFRNAMAAYRRKNLKNILDKTAATNLDKYGVSCSAQNPLIKEKIKNTNRIKYGVDWSTLSLEMQQKSKNTCLEKYGVENAWQSVEVRAKYSERYRKENGIEWPAQRVLTPNNYNLLSTPHVLQEEINRYGVPYLARQLKISHHTIYNAVRRHGLVLAENNSYEAEIADWLTSEKVEFERHNRVHIKPKELDFFLPKQNIGIEFQGTYWHMDPRIYEATDYNQVTHKTAIQHWNADISKINMCLKKDICLIVVWEDDWNNDKSNIKREILDTINKLS